MSICDGRRLKQIDHAFGIVEMSKSDDTASRRGSREYVLIQQRRQRRRPIRRPPPEKLTPREPQLVLERGSSVTPS